MVVLLQTMSTPKTIQGLLDELAYKQREKRAGKALQRLKVGRAILACVCAVNFAYFLVWYTNAGNIPVVLSGLTTTVLLIVLFFASAYRPFICLLLAAVLYGIACAAFLTIYFLFTTLPGEISRIVCTIAIATIPVKIIALFYIIRGAINASLYEGMVAEENKVMQ